jgi:hypothetical protein
MTDPQTKYRDTLERGRDDAQGSYDKAIMTFAGGALTIALGFVRTTEPPEWRWTLIASWLLFATALVLILLSFRKSCDSFTTALEQLSSQVDPEQLYRDGPGGNHTRITERLNQWALWAFLLGLLALGSFMARNLDRLGRKYGDDQETRYAAAVQARTDRGARQDAAAAAPSATQEGLNESRAKAPARGPVAEARGRQDTPSASTAIEATVGERRVEL